MKYLEVGETIEIDGSLYECIKGDDCEECPLFDSEHCRGCSNTPDIRDDDNEIILKKL